MFANRDETVSSELNVDSNFHASDDVNDNKGGEVCASGAVCLHFGSFCVFILVVVVD